MTDAWLRGLHNAAARARAPRGWPAVNVGVAVPFQNAGERARAPYREPSVVTVGEDASSPPPGGVMPPAPVGATPPAPASSSTVPLVLFGLCLAGTVVYLYQHARKDAARMAELESEIDHVERVEHQHEHSHTGCACSHSPPAAPPWAHHRYV